MADGDVRLPTTVPRLRVARLDRRSGALAALLALAHWGGGLTDYEVRAVQRLAVPEYGPPAEIEQSAKRYSAAAN